MGHGVWAALIGPHAVTLASAVSADDRLLWDLGTVETSINLPRSLSLSLSFRLPRRTHEHDGSISRYFSTCTNLAQEPFSQAPSIIGSASTIRRRVPVSLSRSPKLARSSETAGKYQHREPNFESGVALSCLGNNSDPDSSWVELAAGQDWSRTVELVLGHQKARCNGGQTGYIDLAPSLPRGERPYSPSWAKHTLSIPGIPLPRIRAHRAYSAGHRGGRGRARPTTRP